MKIPVKAGGKKVLRVLSDKSPILLTTIGATGVISTAVMSAKAMPKTLDQIKKEEKRHGRRLTKKEMIKLSWRNFIPAGIVGGLSIGAIFGSNRVSTKRAAALSAAYEFTKGTLNEYQKKVVETIGDKKEEKIRDEIKQDRIDKATENSSEIILTGDEVLCMDSYTGRTFKSEYEYVRQVVNDLNAGLLTDDWVSLNEFYYALGLDGIKEGDEIGWNMQKEGLISISYESRLTKQGKPCLYIDYYVGPRIKYGDL